MQEGKLSFRDIFDGDKTFEIPEYQRAFTWERRQLKDFIDDIINQPPDQPYFLGTFLFHQLGKVDEYLKIFIVDGQQRITTANIFIKVILEILAKNGIDKNKVNRRYILDDDMFKLNSTKNDNSFFHTYINMNNKPRAFDTKSQKRLYDAKRFFTEELKIMDDKKLEDILNKLEESLVLVHTVKNKPDAAQIFELINDRGKRLSDLEAIKSFLMYRMSILLKKSEQSLSDIEGDFGKIYRKSEDLEDKIKEDQILTYYVISHLKWTGDDFRNPKEFIKKVINDISIEKNAKKFIIILTKELRETFEIVSDIIDNKNKIQEIDELFMLGRIANFYPLLITAYKFDESKNKEFFKGVANLSELYSFISAIAGKRADTGVKHFYELAKNFQGNYDNLTSNVKIIFRENWWRISSLFKDNADKIYYGDSIVKYLLFKYENHLRKKSGFRPLTLDAFFESDKRLKLSIEHITAKKTKKLIMTEDFKEYYLHNIGNLVLDTVASNASKGNEDVAKKISSYNLAPLISQLEIEDIKIEIENKNRIAFKWNDIEHVKIFIEIRKQKIKDFILTNWDYNIRTKISKYYE